MRRSAQPQSPPGLHGAVGGELGAPMPVDAVGLVEAATSEMLGGNTDWALNMQLVDLLQQTPQDCVAAIETLKPRLRSKKHPVGLNAVVLLEALVKNVPAIHELVGTRDFMEATLVKSLPRSVRKPNEGMSLNSLINEPSDIKSPPAIARWEATLKCIQAWSLAFGPQGRYPIFHEMHRMLERRGVKFPPVDKEENAPVFSPPSRKPAPAASSSSALPSAPPHAQMSPGGPHDRMASSVGVSGSSTEIKSAQEAVKLFNDLLDNSEPGYPLAEDELVQQLYATCRSNAGILSSSLTRAANGGNVDENTMMQLLSTHEAVTETLKYYEGLVSGTRKPRKLQHAAGAASSSSSASAMSPGRRDESKDLHEYKEEEHARRGTPHRAQPAQDIMGLSSMPSAAAQATPSTTPPRARKQSDLPPELSGFDMLGLGPASVSPPPTQQPQQHPPSQAAQASPFDMMSFPPATNPVAALTVQPNAGLASPAPQSTKRGSGSTPGGHSTPLLAPPPATSTRHRKKGQPETPASPAVVMHLQPAAAASPAAAPAPVANMFDLDLLMSNNAPSVTASPQTSQPGSTRGPVGQPGPSMFAASSNDDFFGSANAAPAAMPFSAAFPAQHQAPSGNVFDAFPVAGGGAAAAPADNPFASFDAGDPFADIATRPSNGSVAKNAFDF